MKFTKIIFLFLVFNSSFTSSAAAVSSSSSRAKLLDWLDKKGFILEGTLFIIRRLPIKEPLNSQIEELSLWLSLMTSALRRNLTESWVFLRGCLRQVKASTFHPKASTMIYPYCSSLLPRTDFISSAIDRHSP